MRKIISFFKVFSIFICVIISICILYYIIFVLPTNSIYSEAKKIFSGEIVVEKNNPLSRYNYSYKHFPDMETIDYSLGRVWVWHNGKNGFMKMIYSVKYFDKNGKLIYASTGVPSTWTIEKSEKNWRVVRIKEQP